MSKINNDDITDSDNIFEDEQGWWFWDETGSEVYGPYDTKEIATQKELEYASTL